MLVREQKTLAKWLHIFGLYWLIDVSYKKRKSFQPTKVILFVTHLGKIFSIDYETIYIIKLVNMGFPISLYLKAFPVCFFNNGYARKSLESIIHLSHIKIRALTALRRRIAENF